MNRFIALVLSLTIVAPCFAQDASLADHPRVQEALHLLELFATRKVLFLDRREPLQQILPAATRLGRCPDHDLHYLITAAVAPQTGDALTSKAEIAIGLRPLGDGHQHLPRESGNLDPGSQSRLTETDGKQTEDVVSMPL